MMEINQQGPFYHAAINSLRLGRFEGMMVRLFGRRIVGRDGRFRVYMREFRGKWYVTGFEEEREN